MFIGAKKKVLRCPYCASGRLRRSHRKNVWERMVSLMGIRPYRCGECSGRFLRRFKEQISE